MASNVTHFEIFGDDLLRLAEFYSSLFGWKIEKAAGVDYYRIDTGTTAAMPVAGGLLHRPIPGPRSWVHYVHVDSIDETLDRARNLGGKTLVAKSAVPKTGWYALLEDPEGNVFAIYEPDAAAFPPPKPDE